MNRVVVGIGSNIDAQKNVKSAIRNLGSKYSVVAESKFVETEPIGYKNQDNFLNGAILLETSEKQSELKLQLREIESKLGRLRTANKFGPRPIDLDIVVWNGKVVDDDVYERDFLKEAVLELLPKLNIP